MTDDVIEKAARVLCTLDHGDPDDLIRDYDEYGRVTTSEPAWIGYVEQAQALAEAGLLARPLPTRDEVIDLIQRYFWPFLAQDPANPDRFWGQSADAVLAVRNYGRMLAAYGMDWSEGADTFNEFNEDAPEGEETL